MVSKVNGSFKTMNTDNDDGFNDNDNGNTMIIIKSKIIYNCTMLI